MPDIPMIETTPGTRPRIVGWLSVDGDYKPGDPRPAGYLDWHDWAEIQHKAGLRQERCSRCGRLGFPQEMSGAVCLRCEPRKGEQ